MEEQIHSVMLPTTLETLKSKKMFKPIFAKLEKCSSRTRETTLKVIEAILSKDENEIKRLCEKGLPDDLQMLRSLVWKIILKYLSTDYDKWDDELKDLRDRYDFYKETVTAMIDKEYKDKTYKNLEALGIIRKDINRTYSQFSFFFQPISKDKVYTPEEVQALLKKRQDCDISNIDELYKINAIETHADVLGRILFIYATFNPDLSYNQGMNEILAPIYYCFSSDKIFTGETEEEIEADAFWAFFNLMKEIRNSWDHSDPKGTFFKNSLLEQMLKIVDKELSDTLEENGVKFEYFAYTWFIRLFSQEFEFLDVLKLWDLVFSTKNRFDYVFYTALAYLQHRRGEIIGNDMAGIMIMFQNTQTIEADVIIPLAKQIKHKYEKKLQHLFKQLEDDENE